ncbi:hypothetical protein [Ottowia thiooxydans]|uniref:hypothetical protein n=1 Tax=Ottowia thiooxydans TaxID=219182 RepID=UPI0003F654E9|nr:hypothetical protein [Ottowia thiooxydans]
MFKIGEKYDIEMLDGRDHNGHPDLTTYPGREVLSKDGPLIEIVDAGGTLIINTYSPVFARAKLKKPSKIAEALQSKGS